MLKFKGFPEKRLEYLKRKKPTLDNKTPGVDRLNVDFTQPTIM